MQSISHDESTGLQKQSLDTLVASTFANHTKFTTGFTLRLVCTQVCPGVAKRLKLPPIAMKFCFSTFCDKHPNGLVGYGMQPILL